MAMITRLYHNGGRQVDGKQRDMGQHDSTLTARYTQGRHTSSAPMNVAGTAPCDTAPSQVRRRGALYLPRRGPATHAAVRGVIIHCRPARAPCRGTMRGRERCSGGMFIAARVCAPYPTLAAGRRRAPGGRHAKQEGRL